MDLADIWQEHKKFIITVFGALILLLIGRKIVFMKYDVDTYAVAASRYSRGLNKEQDVRDNQVREVREQAEAMREQLVERVKEMRFETDDLFVLPVGEPNPTAFCWQRTRDMQKVLVNEAARLDITVPELLGLEDSAPTDVQEVRRALQALNVVQTVVVACIESQVRRIESIDIEPQARLRGRAVSFVQEMNVNFEIVGNEKALREVVARIVESPKEEDATAPYLMIGEPTSIARDREDPRFLRLKLSVSALSISVEDLDLDLEAS